MSPTETKARGGNEPSPDDRSTATIHTCAHDMRVRHVYDLDGQRVAEVRCRHCGRDACHREGAASVGVDA